VFLDELLELLNEQAIGEERDFVKALHCNLEIFSTVEN
jgi:hypothetical protein